MRKSSIKKAEDAHKEYQKLVELIQFGDKLNVLKGQQLYRLKANNSFKKAIGEGVNDWGTFLKLPEINISNGEANRMMEMYSVFVLKYGFSIDKVAKAKTKSLHYLLPVVKDSDIEKKRVGEMLDNAINLSQAEFRETVYDLKTDDKGERTYTYLIMKKCNETGTMQKVHGISSEKIVETFNLEDYNVIEVL